MGREKCILQCERNTNTGLKNDRYTRFLQFVLGYDDYNNSSIVYRNRLREKIGTHDAVNTDNQKRVPDVQKSSR